MFLLIFDNTTIYCTINFQKVTMLGDAIFLILEILLEVVLFIWSIFVFILRNLCTAVIRELVKKAFNPYYAIHAITIISMYAMYNNSRNMQIDSRMYAMHNFCRFCGIFKTITNRRCLHLCLSSY